MGNAPQLTYEPWEHVWYEHCPVNGTGRAFANGSNGYQTNRQGTVQIEVSCYCAPEYYGQYGHGVNTLDDRAYDDLREFSEWAETTLGIPRSTSVEWKPYPSSYGAGNGVRLSESEFSSYRGWLGHMHVPHNEHGDPGSLDVQRILTAQQGDWFDMATEEDLTRIIDERLMYHLSRFGDALRFGTPNATNPPGPRYVDNMGLDGKADRLANVLRNGQPNSLFSKSGPAVDGKGLDGIIRENGPGGSA